MDPNRPPGPPEGPPEPPPPPPPGEPWYASPDGGEPYLEDQGGPAWEYRDHLGAMKAAALTVREVLFQPEQTFTTATRRGGLASPWLYGFVMGLIFGALAALRVSIMAPADLEEMKEQLRPIYEAVAESVGADPDQLMDQSEPFLRLSTGWGLYAKIVLRAALFPLIYALILHAFMALFGGTNESFEATFRVAAYAFGAAMVIRWLPICGGFVGFVWQLVVTAIGVTAIHRASAWQGVFAVILSLVFTCCCPFTLFLI